MFSSGEQTVRGVFGVQAVARHHPVEDRAAAVSLGPQQSAQPLRLLLPRPKGARNLHRHIGFRAEDFLRRRHDCRFVDLENPRDFSCDPSIRTLMAESAAGRSTVMRALMELEAKGFITRRPQFHDSGALGDSIERTSSA